MTKGNSSHGYRAALPGPVSLGNHDRRILEGKCTQTSLIAPGSLDDDGLVRNAIAVTLKRSTLSREQIAEAMSLILGQRVTEKMLNSYSAPSMQANRFPAAWQRAFCRAADDDLLLRCCAELAGFRLLTPEEADLLELGREYLQHERAAQKVAAIKARLGVEL